MLTENSFDQYLSSNAEELKKNIKNIDSGNGFYGRLFNDFPALYDSSDLQNLFQHFDKIKSNITNGLAKEHFKTKCKAYSPFSQSETIDATEHMEEHAVYKAQLKTVKLWSYFAAVVGLKDLFDFDGQVKREIQTILNQNTSREDLFSFFNENTAESARQKAGKYMFFSGYIGSVISDNVMSRLGLLPNNSNVLAVDSAGDPANQIEMKIFNVVTNYLNEIRDFTKEPNVINRNFISNLHDWLLKNCQKKLVYKPLKTTILTFLYSYAKDDLNHTIQFKAVDEFSEKAKEILELTNDLGESNKTKTPKPKMIKVIRATNELLLQPTESKIADYRKLAKKVGKRSWGKLIMGSMLALAGIALGVACGVGVAASYGLLAPAGIAGFALSTTMIAGGVSMAVGGASLTGLGSLLFFKGTKKGSPLRKEMETFANQVEKTILPTPR